MMSLLFLTKNYAAETLQRPLSSADAHRLSETRKQHDEQQTEQPSYKCVYSNE